MKQKLLLSGKRIACLDIHSPSYLRAKDNVLGAGDIDDLYVLIDLAATAGFKMIQMIPIQDTGESVSPYMGVSAFSLNPIHLSIKRLNAGNYDGLVRSYRKMMTGKEDNLLEYRHLRDFKIKVLRHYYKEPGAKIKNFDKVDDNVLSYATFVVLKKHFGTSWSDWPVFFRRTDARGILRKYKSFHDEVRFEVFAQQTMLHQWQELSRYAKHKGIIIGLDKPIYPIHDSADVWANQSLFYLNRDGSLKYKSGCNNPYDPFGEQTWGHAVYKFKEKPKEVIDFFCKSVKFMSQISKIIRIDHALALVWKYYLIDAKKDTGKHVEALKDRILGRLIKEFPDVFFIAEDVGFVSEDVDRPLNKFGLPGIRTPQWSKHPRYAQIADYPELCFAATSNHDLDSIHAWWKKLKHSQKYIYYKQMKDLYHEHKRRKKIRLSPEDATHRITQLVFDSPALIASTSIRDLAGDLRAYNKPGKINNTNWKLICPQALEEINFSAIANVIKSSGRV